MTTCPLSARDPSKNAAARGSDSFLLGIITIPQQLEVMRYNEP